MVLLFSVLRRHLVAAAILLFAAAPIACQCGFDWQPGAPNGGPSGAVTCIAPLANGDLVVGGSFELADGAVANNIARWDGTTWHALGSGVDDRVLALLVLANGDLLAAGRFLNAGGVPANRIARWNGSTWSPLGTGFATEVKCLLQEPGGAIVAGGVMSRWNGATWQPLGAGTQGTAFRVVRMANGDLLAGTSVGLERWNGTTWTDVPGIDGNVMALAQTPNGDVVAGGTVILGGTSGGVVVSLAVYDGTQVHHFPAAINGPVLGLSVAPNGDLLVASAGYTFYGFAHVHRWNGSSLANHGPLPLTWVLAVAHDAAGQLVAGGHLLGNTTTSPVLAWNGTSWDHVGAPSPALTNTAVEAPNGDVFVGGTFAAFRGVPANNLVRRRDGVWSALGSGVGGTVRAMAIATNGDLLVSGDFTTAGGAPANRIARWNGFAWSTLGNGLAAAATDLAMTPNGDVFAIDDVATTLHRFDGTAWTAVQVPVPSSSTLHSLAARPDGSLLLGGAFFTLPGLIRYQSGAFLTLGGAPQIVDQMTVAPNGDVTMLANLALGGASIVRWNGATFTNLGTTSPLAPFTNVRLIELPNGEAMVVGPFTAIAGVPANGIARWNGQGWSEVAGGAPQGTLSGAIVANDGALVTTGAITTVGGAVSVGFALADAGCPALATVVGAGCTGAAGPLALHADNRPWVGSLFAATATGFPAQSLGLHVIGTQPIVQALPLGAPGCSLFTSPVLTEVLFPAAGMATATLTVPVATSLAGLTVRTQAVGLELHPTLGLVRVTSSNALELTIGAF